MKIFFSIIAAFLCATASTVSAQGCNGMNGKRVYIIADDGQRLARCNRCGPGAYADSASVHGKAGDSFAMWTLVKVGRNKCALRADTENYLARCGGCWQNGAYPDSVFVHAQQADSAFAQWTMQRHGKYFSFKADTGKYMARCNGCVPGGSTSNFAFVHSDSPTGAALWKVQIV